MNSSRMISLPLAWGLILVIFLLDQWSKWVIVNHVGFQEAAPLIPGFFNLTHVYNTGAAFSMLHDSNRFFTFLSSVVFLVVPVVCEAALVFSPLSCRFGSTVSWINVRYHNLCL